MQTLWSQRWRDRRDSYRPAGEPIDTRRYEVAAIPGDGPARAFVLRHHYSDSYPAARLRFGLYRIGVRKSPAAPCAKPCANMRNPIPAASDAHASANDPRLAGVAVFSVPMNDAVLTNVFDVPPVEATELGRFVLTDEVPANGETWFLRRCFDLLRGVGVVGVVSHSDPQRRQDASGAVVFGGHIGNIYQAHNARYLGRTARRTQLLLPDGTVLPPRAVAKVRAVARGDAAKGKGWAAVVRLLRGHGMRKPRPGEDLARWLDAAVAALTRRVPHLGNHRYAWALNQGTRRALARRFPDELAYPKWPA